MIDLRPLIHRFVDEVLQAIHDASAEELRDLVRGAQGEPRPAPSAGAPRSRGTRAARPGVSRTSPRLRARASLRPVRSPRPQQRSPSVAEITDPEALLAAAAADTYAKAPQAAPTAAEPLDPEPRSPTALPPSASRSGREETAQSEPSPPPSGAKLVLRPDESLARASDHGVVIRRRKRVAP